MFEPVSGSPADGVTLGPAGGRSSGGAVPPGVTEPGMVVLGELPPGTVVVGVIVVVVDAWLTVIVNEPDAVACWSSVAAHDTVVTPIG